MRVKSGRAVVVVVLMALASIPIQAAPSPSPSPSVEWTSLFNGRDLAGWDTWLGIPHASVTGLDLPKDEAGKYTAAQGLNSDPKEVFTVVTVDGAPAIRISGEMFGALTSLEEYGDFHLRLEFKWGEKRWPPRETVVRDSGILYYAVGEPGAADNKAWMRSLECQVQEHDVGDFWGVGGTYVDVAGDAEGEGKDRKVVHRPGAPIVTVGATPRRAIKSLDNENPTGAWNTVELLCLRGTCLHVVNGKTNLVLASPRQTAADGSLVPLMKGRVQIQSEGAEVFYRNIQVRPIAAFPAGRKP
jgi:hypothetical protein